ncbi:MAG: helix-turn-helix domain-containing protein [Pseudonocardia sp.]
MPAVPEGETGPRLISTTQAAKALGISQSTLSRWTKAGYVRPAQRTIGGHMRWDLDDLRRQVAEITDPDQN